MKTLFWDSIDENGQPYTWGDKRLRWGNPSVILEIGDPDYPYEDFPIPPQLKRNRTMKQRYFPTRYADQVIWLENFRNKIGGYAAALGLGQPEVDTLIAKCLLAHLPPRLLAACRARLEPRLHSGLQSRPDRHRRRLHAARLHPAHPAGWRHPAGRGRAELPL